MKFRSAGSCIGASKALVSSMRRARSASRSKLNRMALRAIGRSIGRVDESATGSANFFGPTVVLTGNRWVEPRWKQPIQFIPFVVREPAEWRPYVLFDFHASQSQHPLQRCMAREALNLRA